MKGPRHRLGLQRKSDGECTVVTNRVGAARAVHVKIIRLRFVTPLQELRTSLKKLAQSLKPGLSARSSPQRSTPESGPSTVPQLSTAAWLPPDPSTSHSNSPIVSTTMSLLEIRSLDFLRGTVLLPTGYRRSTETKGSSRHQRRDRRPPNRTRYRHQEG